MKVRGEEASVGQLLGSVENWRESVGAGPRLTQASYDRFTIGNVARRPGARGERRIGLHPIEGL
eukprot:7803128-Pyramimonas_sp.AAC.1